MDHFFYRSRSKTIKQLWMSGGLLVLMIAIAAFSFGSADGSLKIGIFAIAFFLLIGYFFASSLSQLNSKLPLLSVTAEGITAGVTPVSKATGTMLWKDIRSTEIVETDNDTLVLIHLNRTTPYAERIRKKLSKMALDGIIDQEADQLTIPLTASELEGDAHQVHRAITESLKSNS
ncbi:STM3941 family protein [Pedobacter sp. BAL39]|uniref:STM3941 family protein n=1 Tax=Pedobacter sp. BAL39 TaxID=391596 RepID=UPI0026F3D108|nr:STM3941 family protein [Pedobacter sp. BAL39]